MSDGSLPFEFEAGTVAHTLSEYQKQGLDTDISKEDLRKLFFNLIDLADTLNQVNTFQQKALKQVEDDLISLELELNLLRIQLESSQSQFSEVEKLIP